MSLKDLRLKSLADKIEAKTEVKESKPKKVKKVLGAVKKVAKKKK